ncbi:MAG: hypothetical protein M9955_17500 [Rhizobiaceae bacterium]|nr:hypothetical protein [Rhizobiaceae bacterium]
MTLDGMVRALRWQAHRMAEEAEGGYPVRASEEAARPMRVAARGEELGDDRIGE